MEYLVEHLVENLAEHLIEHLIEHLDEHPVKRLGNTHPARPPLRNLIAFGMVFTGAGAFCDILTVMFELLAEKDRTRSNYFAGF